MPWKTSSLAEARKRFVQAAQRGLKSVAQLCRENNISRKTGFKWLTRFHTEGGPGLQDRSRRPRRSPVRTPIRWIRAIAQIRRKRRYWGAKKVYARLRRQHPCARLPKVRTITNWLKRLKFTRPRRAWACRGPRIACGPLTIPSAPNEVWTVDFKGWFRTLDGQRVDPLTVRDLFSRFILGIRLLTHEYEAHDFAACLANTMASARRPTHHSHELLSSSTSGCAPYVLYVRLRVRLAAEHWPFFRKCSMSL